MERYSNSLTRRLLTFVILTFLALTFLGCMDPMVADMEAERQEVGFYIEQELQRCRMASQANTQVISLPPAQSADMAAERRELDKMVERGDWRRLSPVSSASQSEVFHPAP